MIFDDPKIKKQKINTPERVETKQKRVPLEVRRLQTSYNDAARTYNEVMNDNAFMGFALASESTMKYPDEPTMFQEVWHHEDAQEREGWQTAIRKEFHDMIKRGVWRRIKKREVPSDRRTIGSKWVFKCKRDGRYRARLCGLGYTQIADIDFNANFAPVVNDVIFQLLLIIKMMMRRSSRSPVTFSYNLVILLQAAFRVRD